MPRGDQVARLYTLVMDLARVRHGVTAAALAQRHGLKVRTVYRDLHALEEAGFPMTTAGGGRWKLIEGWEGKVPFPLPVEQLLALHLSRGLMKPLRGTPLAKSFDTLFERLVGPHADEVRGQGNLFPRLRVGLALRSQLAIDYSAHSALLETLCRACESRARVRAVYYTETRREVTRREIDPYALYYDPQLEAIYVFGWCRLRKGMRTFAVHRFRQAVMTQKHFEAPMGFTADSYLRGAFRIWRGENTFTLRIAIDAEAAGWVSERRWHASQKVRRLAGGGCEMTFTVDGVQEVRRFVLQLGSAAEVVEPDWFRREIAEEQERAAQRNRRWPRKKMSPDDTSVSHTERG